MKGRATDVVVEIIEDGGDQTGHTGERAAADALPGDLRKPAFDQAEPGTARGNEVKMEAWMAGQPPARGATLVGAGVVDDQVQGHGGIGGRVQAPQKLHQIRGRAGGRGIRR